MEYINLDFIKDEKIGCYEVKTMKITEEQAYYYNLRAIINNRLEELVNSGIYKKLTKFGEILMTNTQLEIRTHEEAIKQSKGNILVAGLGLGMFLTAIKNKKDVDKIIVVEKSKEVIEMIGKYYNDSKIEIINEDIFNFNTDMKFDLIWLDIWSYLDKENLKEMNYLRKKFSLNSDNILCWSENILRKKFNYFVARSKGNSQLF